MKTPTFLAFVATTSLAFGLAHPLPHTINTIEQSSSDSFRLLRNGREMGNWAYGKGGILTRFESEGLPNGKSEWTFEFKNDNTHRVWASHTIRIAGGGEQKGAWFFAPGEVSRFTIISDGSPYAVVSILFHEVKRAD